MFWVILRSDFTQFGTQSEKFNQTSISHVLVFFLFLSKSDFCLPSTSPQQQRKKSSKSMHGKYFSMHCYKSLKKNFQGFA